MTPMIKNNGFPSFPIGMECLKTVNINTPITNPSSMVITISEIIEENEIAIITPIRVESERKKLTVFEGCS